MTDLTRDPRAGMVDDIVTIVVSERASAVSSGATKSARSSSASGSVSAIGGPTRATGALANLARLSSDSKLDGQGSTSRETVLTTTLSARIVALLPNGNMVVEGTKNIQVNSETQKVTVRGVIRPADVMRDNTVPSDRLAQLEVVLNGKGVVADAVRRPMFLYRLLLGLLPF
jgi:flagellar L-ring protein precursor FlgH